MICYLLISFFQRGEIYMDDSPPLSVQLAQALPFTVIAVALLVIAKTINDEKIKRIVEGIAYLLLIPAFFIGLQVAFSILIIVFIGISVYELILNALASGKKTKEEEEHKH